MVGWGLIQSSSSTELIDHYINISSIINHILELLYKRDLVNVVGNLVNAVGNLVNAVGNLINF